jgi:hypothetical protein
VRAVVAIAIAATGCFSPAFQPGLPCANGTECPGDLVCVDQVCVAATPDGGGGGVDADLGPDAFCAPGCSGDTLMTCSAPDRTCTAGCLDDAAGARCALIVPSNGVDRTLVDMVSVPITVGGATTFDTDSGAISGAVTRGAGTGVIADIGYFQAPPSGNGGAPLAIFVIADLTIGGGVTATFSGSRAVVLLIGGTATIDGTIAAAGNGPIAGPGGGAGATTTAVAQGCGAGGDGMKMMAADGGGGGAGGATAGAVGGNGGNGAPGGTAGAACSTALLEPLVGGSGGGRASPGLVMPPDPLGFGGGGGGAMQITAIDRIDVGASGAIVVGGGGGEAGGGGTGDAAGGGGGGSGGAILLEAGIVTNAGILAANGGGGGGAGSSSGGPGTSGTAGGANALPAQGGIAGGTSSGGGGSGGAGAAPPTEGIDATAAANGGGGGGAVGAIAIRARTPTIAGTISPAHTPGGITAD